MPPGGKGILSIVLPGLTRGLEMPNMIKERRSQRRKKRKKKRRPPEIVLDLSNQ